MCCFTSVLSCASLRILCAVLVHEGRVCKCGAGDVLGKVEEEVCSPDEVRFIDGDPEYFPLIVAYLEKVKCCKSEPSKELEPVVLPRQRSSLKKLKQEALFYGLKGFAAQIDTKLLELLALS